ATGDDGLAVDAGRGKDISAVLLVDLQLARRPCAGWSQQKRSGAGTTCDGFPLRLGAKWRSVALGRRGRVGAGRLACGCGRVPGRRRVQGSWRPVVERRRGTGAARLKCGGAGAADKVRRFSTWPAGDVELCRIWPAGQRGRREVAV